MSSKRKPSPNQPLSFAKFISEGTSNEAADTLDIMLFTRLSSKTHKDILNSIRDTEGDKPTVKLRNWMCKAYEALKETES